MSSMTAIYAFADQIKVYKAILDSTAEIQNWLRYHSVHLVQTKNEFGKVQSDIDLAANDIVAKHLASAGVVFGYASEEQPKFNPLSD